VNRLIHPVGPEPTAVYWRRRAAVLAGLIIVIFALVMIIKALGSGGSDKPKATPSPTAQATATQSEGPGQGAVEACVAEQLTGGKLADDGADVALSATKASFAEGETVTLTADVKNMSDKDCSLLNNPHTVSLNVVSGSDRIFDSSDCASETAADSGDSIVIKAGETVSVPIAWDALRSQQGCREITEKPHRSADNTYIATVKILTVPSDEARFALTP
jgi:hypothetical protein